MSLVLLQAARLKGRLTSEQAAVFVGEPAEPLLAELAEMGLLTTRGRLTQEGKDRLAALLDAERLSLDHAALSALYEEFDLHNTALKEIVTAWQLHPDGSANDHYDGTYDGAVVASLVGAGAAAQSLVMRIAQTVPRLDSYPPRLATALERVQAGEHRYIANPMADSYHQIWFELHEDLLGLLGRSRVEEALAGRAE
jgi:pyruvate,orthophosphate dikinase